MPDTSELIQVQGMMMENGQLRVTVEENGTATIEDKVSGAVYQGLNSYENTGDIGNEYVYRQPEGETTLTTEHLKADLRIVEQSPYRAVMESVLRWDIPAGADELFELEKRQIVGILGFHLLGDLRRAVVGVDELVEMLPEAEREPEVLLGCLAHERSKRAACPCPTPTQSVARP